MGLRPAKCYRTHKDRAYSRIAIKVHKRNYIGAVPGLKTRQFNMGNPLKKYDTIVDLIAENEDTQLRDNSLESVRIAVNRFLVKRVGKDNFFMRLRVYPHQILRENKMATGAGADRVSQGMGNCPFGKPIGRAARIRPGQTIMSVLVNKEHADLAKQGLLRARSRVSSKINVKIGTDVASIGTLPKKVREEKVEEKIVEAAAEGAAAETPTTGKTTGKPQTGKEAKPTAGGKDAAKPEAKKEEKKKFGKK
ncbi:MAG: 50S ribosomal protein L16 [archaeon]|nr:50S ribosomal protein L16 [archaeon]